MPRVGSVLIAGLLAMTAGCSLLVDVPPVPGQRQEDIRRKRIEITSPLGEFGLDDYTVAIQLDEDPDIAARGIQENVTFHDETGTRLPSELERFTGQGSVVAWVKVPELLSQDDGPTVVFIHYGGPPVDPSPLRDVWPPPFAGVWHLNGTGEPEYPDSSRGDNPAIGSAATAPEDVATVIAKGLYFDGTAQLTIDDPETGALDFGRDSFAYSMWIQADGAAPDTLPWSKGGVPVSRPGYAIQIGPDDWQAVVSDGINEREVGFGGPAFGPWRLLSVLVNRDEGTVEALIDGETMAAGGDAFGLGPVATSDDVTIGDGFVGQLDEIRVFSDVVAKERFGAEFDMQLDPAAFYAVGAEEELP